MSDNLSEIKDEIKDRINIIDFIGRYISLKRVGSNYMGLCPFHDDSKSPSFSVVPDKGFYHCFGCGKSGDIFTFLMEHDSLTFGDALKQLAEEAGVELKNSNGIDTKSLHSIMKLSHEIFVKNLVSSATALSYLQSRNIDLKWAVDFGIGYALDGWGDLKMHLFNNAIDTEKSIELGLLASNKNNKVYDKFRDRILLPFYNDSGLVVGYTGRLISNKDQAKYLNSPESPIFHKSKLIFGFHKSKEYIRDKKDVIIVEGNLDFISLYYRGIKNVVAISGTAFSSYQAKKISMLCKHATIMLDGDSAGLKAAKRSLAPLLENGFDVDIVALPNGEDPDSYIVKNGKDALLKYVSDKGIDFINFIRYYYKNVYGDKYGDISTQNEIFKEFIFLLREIKDRYIVEILISRIEMIFKFNSAFIRESLNMNYSNESVLPVPHNGALKKAYLSSILLFLLKMPKYIKSFIENIDNKLLGDWIYFFEKMYDFYEKYGDEELENRYFGEFIISKDDFDGINKKIKDRILKDNNKIKFKTIINYKDKLNKKETRENRHYSIEELLGKIDYQYSSIVRQLKNKR